MPIYSIEGPDGKTYSIEGPAGATRDEVIRAIQMKMAAPPAEIVPAVQPQMPVAPQAPATQRTFGEAIQDVPAAALSGIGSLLQFPGQIVKMLPGLTGAGEFLEKPGEAVSGFGDYLKSEGLKAREALRSKAISEAEKDGVLSSFATAIVSTIKDPALITTFVAEQVPLLLGPLGAAKLTQKLGAEAVKSAGVGLTGKAAEDAVKAAADRLSRRAYGAAYGTGSAMQAADVSSDAYEDALRKAREMNLSEEEAQSKALAAGRIAGIGAGAVSLLAQRLPGAKAIEQRLAGVPGTAGRLGAAVGESLSEAIEEGGGQIFKNIGLRQVDPNQPLLEGVGGAAGLGALGGGTLGALLGKKAEEARFEGQREGESDREFAFRLQQEIAAGLRPPAPPPEGFKPPTDQQLFNLAAQPSGYGMLENLKQRLISDQSIPEDQKNPVIANIRSIQERMNIEEVERRRATPGAEERFLRPEILSIQQLFNIASQEGGYGQLEIYKQNLLKAKQDKEIKDAINEVQELQNRMNIEQVERLRPIGAPPGPLLPTDTEAQQKARGMELGKLGTIVENMGKSVPGLQELIADPEALKKAAKKEKLPVEEARSRLQQQIEYINSVLPVYTQVLQQRKQEQQQTREAEKAQAIANLTPEEQAIRSQAEAMIKELAESGVPEFVSTASGAQIAFNNNNFKTEKDLQFLKSKVESYRNLQKSSLVGKPVDELSLESLNKDHPKDLQKIQDASKDQKLADLFARVNDAMARSAQAVNSLGMSWGGINSASPTNVKNLNSAVNAMAGGVGRLSNIKQAIDKGYKTATNDPLKLERAIRDIEADIANINQLIPKIKAPAPAPAVKAPGAALVVAKPEKVKRIEGPKPRPMPLRAVELPQPKAPVTEEAKQEAAVRKDIEKDIRKAEMESRKARRESISLWGQLIGQLDPSEVRDISPDRRLAPLNKKGGGGFFLDYFVDSGLLDEFLPPDMRHNAVQFETRDSQEYIKDLIRKGDASGYITWDAKAEIAKNGAAIEEMERLLRAFNTEELNAQLQEISDEQQREEEVTGEVQLATPRGEGAVAKGRVGAPQAGEVIDVEARVVDETLGPKVAALPAPQIATLEKHYGVDRNSPSFLQKIKEDIVLYATKGGKAVAAIIRPIIRNLHAAVVSLAVIFNPNNISPAEAVIFDKQVITETKDIRVAPPESVASKMSAGAKEAYSILYPSIKDQLQRDNKLMLIVDKPNARMFVFTPDGQPLLDKKVLLGRAVGDLYKGNNDLPQNRITPAGLFKMGLRDADRSISEARTAGEYDFKKVFVLDKAIEGEYSVTLFHSVWLKESDAALRAKALKSESETDSRYSFGCINVDKQTYERLITDHLNQMDGASLFIVPDNQAATAEFLTGATARNVSGADGLTRTTFTPAKETVAYEVKRAGRPGEIMREVSKTPVKKSLAEVAKGVPEGKFRELERKAKEAKPAAPEVEPEAPAERVISPEIQEKIETLKKVLKKNLAKYGLKDIDLNLEEGMTDEGSFSGQLIRIALDSPDPLGILRHESVHALKEAGFFTDKQWATLERMADQKWIDEFLRGQEVEYEGQRMSRYDAYMKEYGGNMAFIREEAIADAFRSFSKKQPAGLMGALTTRMKNFFKAVKSAFNGEGFESAEDIFGKIEEGKLEAAPTKESTAKEVKSSLRAHKDLFDRADEIPMSEGVEAIRDDWVGGVAGVGNRDSMYDLFRIEGGTEYTGEVQKFLRNNLGENFKGYRLMSQDEFEELKSASMGSQFVSFSLNPDVAKGFKNLPAYAKRKDLVVIEMDLTPEHVHMIGHPGEQELVVDYGQGYNPAEIKVVEGDVERKSLRAPDTEAFKKWFGDSKVVDAEGRPLVVYHGARPGTDITRFQAPSDADGIYFTPDSQYAEAFTDELFTDTGARGAIYPVYLSIKNPYVVRATWGSDAAENFLYRGLDRRELDKQGYDGAMLYIDGELDQVQAFRPEQIKSAIGNIGTFEPTSPDIRKSLRGAAPEDLRNSLSEMRISPRYPTAAKATEDPMGDVRLQPDLNTFKQNRQSFIFNIGLMNRYPNFRGMRGSADDRVEQMILQMQDNLTWLYNHWKPNFRERSRLWYVGGNRISHRWAKRYDMPPEKVAGVIAALSPQKGWFANVSIAERMLDAVVNNADTKWDASMSDVLRNREWGNKLSKVLKYSPVEQLARFEGKTLREIYRPGDQASLLDMAVWIRAWDEAKNPQVSRVITPEGRFTNDLEMTEDGSRPMPLRAQGFGPMTRALMVLQAQNREDISLAIGDFDKVRSFYNNIISPYNNDDVTIDTHAVAAALLRPLGSSDLEVSHNFGSAPEDKSERAMSNSSITGLHGSYSVYAEAYRRAARDLGVLPRELQSITWEAVRGLFRPGQKVGAKERANQIWRQVASGAINANEARREISKLVGGIEDPAWTRSPVGSNEAARDSSYQGELPGVGQPGRPEGRGGELPAGTQVERKSLRAAASSWTDERVGKLVNDYGYTDGRTYGLAAWISPEEFLRATTYSPKHAQEISAEAEDLTTEDLQKKATPYLRVNLDTGQIIGHEGRHRMAFLAKEGISSAPVLIVPVDSSDRRLPNDYKPMEILPLQGQNFGKEGRGVDTAVTNLVPLVYTQEKRLKEEFANPERIRYSMRSLPVVGSTLQARIDETVRPRREAGFVERMIDAISPKSHSAFREQLINQYNYFASLDKQVAKMIKEAGGAEQLADQQAEPAALFSDMASAVASSALGAHNRKGGIPTYRNGVVTVDASGDNEGPVVIFAPLASFGDPKAFQHWQWWAGVNRAKKYILDPSGRRYVEKLFTEDDIRDAERLRLEYKRQGVDFIEIQKRWRKYNNGLVKLMRDTGVISGRAAEEFMEHGDYFPFYRQISEEEMTGPKTFSTIAGTKPPRAAKGSEEALGDFFETVVRNTQAAITASMKNVAAQRATSQALRIQEVIRLSQNPRVAQTGATTWDVFDSEYADTISAANEAAAQAVAQARYGVNATVEPGARAGQWSVFKPVKIAEIDAASAAEANELARLNHLYKPSPFVYRVFENGQPIYYKAYDINFINALKSLSTADLPFIGLLSAPANALRTLVTKEPGYMLVNQMRDSLSAWVTSGVKVTPIVDSARQFGRSIAKETPEMEALFNGGIIGGYEYAHGARESGKFLSKEIRRKAGVKSVTERALSPLTSLWGALERGTQVSDGATRAEVYKRVLAETGNEAEALWQAAEVLNFYRHGRSPVIRILTAIIPFLNSRIQGLDVLYRAGMNPMFDSTATDRQRQRMKTFWVRGMTMFALSGMYWLMVHDDDEYKKQEQETRDNYWIIPGIGAKIAIPFEVGVIFKVLPERILQNAFGTDTGKDSLDSLKRQLQSTFMFTLIPQALLPYYEVATNFSFYTQRPIIGQGMEGVAPRFQVAPGTSYFAQVIADKLRIETPEDSSEFTKALAKQLEISPIKLDHMIKGYTGTIGQYAVEVFDAIFNMNADVPKPSKRFEQLPIIKRLALDPEARGTVTAFFDLKNSVDEVVRTSNLLERTMNYQAYSEYLQANINMLANREYVLALNKSMTELREMKNLVRYSGMDKDAKRDTILAIEKMENQLTANIAQVRSASSK